MAYGNKFDLKT